MINHVGKMKNNGARVIVVYRTLPGDANSALVVGTSALGDSYHDALINLVQSNEGQQASELSEVLHVRRFPDGSNMLHWLHLNGHLKKVPTSSVFMTPTTQEKENLSLDTLNELLAQQKGTSINELAYLNVPKEESDVKKIKKETSENSQTEEKFELTPDEMRARADTLFKQAQQLRKQADAIDPPKSKSKKVSQSSQVVV